MLLPTIDFETYSEAGFTYDSKTGKWLKIGPKGGIQDVGAWAYSRHPSTEVLWLSYDMRDGRGVQSWFPWCEPPADLFDYVRNGGVVEAHNSFFEYGIWNNVFTRQCGAPPAPIGQFYDTAAACSAWGLPRSLEDAAKVLGVTQQKDTATARQVKKLWMPRKATKNNPRLRHTLEHDTELHMMNGAYCEQDVRTEIDVSLAVPALSEYEHRVWQLDQQINARGVHIDRPALNDAIEIIRQMREKYIPMQQVLTGGAVKSPNSYAALRQWVCDQGIEIPDTQATTIEETLERDDLPDVVRQVLDIQVLAGGAAIKKIYAMDRFADLEDNRIRGVFSYYGAVATGRWASRGVQLHNNPNSGPDAWECAGCGEHYGTQHQTCPYCHADAVPCRKCGESISRAAGACGCGKKPEADEWGAEAAESVVRLMKHRTLDHMETVWGNAQKAITSAIRAFITAGPDHDLMCSDYSAIEARVLACLAGEDWRIDVFRTHGKIYEASAAQIFGLTMEDFSTYKAENGSHHPARKKGKISELAAGYGGGVGAFKAFGADKFLSEKEIQELVRDWRAASPAVVALWRGLEDAAINAIRNPGQCYRYRYIAYQLNPADGVLYCQLPSGRLLTYHGAWLTTVYVRWEESGQLIQDPDTGLMVPERVRCDYPYPVDGGKPQDVINHMGTPRKGGGGTWVRCKTWGGTLTENCIAEGSLVLTDSGWKSIESVTALDRVHDGVEFVTHGGLKDSGEQPVIVVDGVAMTPDHRVLTRSGWREARHGGELQRPVIYGDPPVIYGATPGTERVYDILNAGPRQRFVVLGSGGPFIVHNCAQAVSRDLLADAMLRLDAAGYPIVMHVHDEIIAEVPHGFGSVEEFERIMGTPPAWAADWPIKAADGWRGLRYRK